MGYEAYLPVFKALCDETRLRILKMLNDQGEMCACRIQEAFCCSQPTISYHMRVLTEAGLVQGRREGCLMCYQAAGGAWDGIAAFCRAMDGLRAKEE